MMFQITYPRLYTDDAFLYRTVHNEKWSICNAEWPSWIYWPLGPLNGINPKKPEFVRLINKTKSLQLESQCYLQNTPIPTVSHACKVLGLELLLIGILTANNMSIWLQVKQTPRGFLKHNLAKCPPHTLNTYILLFA